MIRKDKRIQKDGSVKTYIRVTEGYRPGPGLAPKQRTIKSFGYLEDQPDPAAFLREVAAFDADPANRHSVSSVKMYSGPNRRLNYGYRFLEAVYESLGIDEFLQEWTKTSGLRATYPLKEIFRYLVISRILAPDSNRASLQRQHGFFGWDLALELPQVYRAMDAMARFGASLQRHLDEQVKKGIGRDLAHAFYDVTNYYFETDLPDEPGELRQRGVSKEHRVDPIVQMGLFLDSNGLPVSMTLFPGNTSDTKTLQPSMSRVKAAYGIGRLVVVGDKGINSSCNLDTICQNGDGYVVSQILKGTRGRRYQKAMLEEDGYVYNRDRTYKYKLFSETYTGLGADGKKQTRQRQVLIYWHKAQAEMARKKREEKLRRAARASRNGAYGIQRGAAEYSKEILVDRSSGEVMEDLKAVRVVDYDKAQKDAIFDGYACLLTSEMDYDAAMMRKVYGGLWRIEHSFRTLKTDLLARPVHVSSQEHIQAHFLICFTALLIVRLMQYAMGERPLSAERIARALEAATLRERPGGYVELDDVGGSMAFEKRVDRRGEIVDTLCFSAQDEVALDYRRIQQSFGHSFYDAQVKREQFLRFLKGIQYPIA